MRINGVLVFTVLLCVAVVSFGKKNMCEQLMTDFSSTTITYANTNDRQNGLVSPGSTATVTCNSLPSTGAQIFEGSRGSIGLGPTQTYWCSNDGKWYANGRNTAVFDVFCMSVCKQLVTDFSSTTVTYANPNGQALVNELALPGTTAIVTCNWHAQIFERNSMDQTNSVSDLGSTTHKYWCAADGNWYAYGRYAVVFEVFCVPNR